jgi:beta-xylosidase
MPNAFASETYSNPVLNEKFMVKFAGRTMMIGLGDPTVLFYDGLYYLYATGDNYSYHVYTSSDLVSWDKGPVVFRSKENGLWAPDVFHNMKDNKFYLYYTSNRKIGVAVSDKPDGYFKKIKTLKMDAIDAHMFMDDDGRYYLYYASYPALEIYVQPMDGPVNKKGNPKLIISPSEPWERKLITVTEAPWMLKHKGIYYLLYSGGGSDSIEYSIGYATSRSPLGPFKKHKGNPVFKKGNGVLGPGHSSVTKDAKGKLWMVYHQRETAKRGWDRFIAIDEIWFDSDGVIQGEVTRHQDNEMPAVTDL